MQRDATDERSFLAQGHGPGHALTGFVGGAEGRDPLLGYAVLLGVRDDQQGTGHLPFTDEALHVGRVL